ncbi:CmcI family methyltransferase [Xinfangfangia sp. CPCC 101601]|uniref:CmcI family methyltransferase n=1 Tax=Pseudogemmobacter lacusdianii TaxID=3069608 RepID=A0ABU0VZR7_9RHOB|nr:CmcI family methyltransferase [Xinfangfangia sp. CPCC 101601]MDQ2067254.1 CmcI family methyltransferase [Xinfangfangia sp. CPCC 101601]
MVLQQVFGEMALPRPVIVGMQKGIMSWSYRGRPTWKCPMDLAIYGQILWELRPRTVLEFGSNRGGSALWFADQLTAFGVEDFKIYSLDISPVNDLEDSRIVFGFCDVADPAAHIGLADLRALPKPLLVIDDASHMAGHVLAVLRFVDQAMQSGDYLIVEDGSLVELGWADEYDGGPLAALQVFLAERGDDYKVDRNRCDTFGHNVTWNPEGYLKRV